MTLESSVYLTGENLTVLYELLQLELLDNDEVFER